ncbi:MAG: hypothetical protein WCG99_00480 [Candidatus Berkelbacteria bacterium]
MTWDELNRIYWGRDLIRVSWEENGCVRKVRILIMHHEDRYGSHGAYVFSQSLTYADNPNWRGADSGFHWQFDPQVSAENPSQGLVTFLNDLAVPELWRTMDDIVFCQKIGKGSYKKIGNCSLKVLRQLERFVGRLETTQGLDHRVLHRTKGMLDQAFNEIMASSAKLHTALS